MKVAYTMNGLFGGFVDKNYLNDNSSDAELVMKYSYLELNKYILKNNDVDLFIFSWHDDMKTQIEDYMSPVKLELSKQIDFEPFEHLKSGDVSRVKAHISRWYGFQRVMNLVKEYEIENKFKYDLIVNARMDLCWKNPFDFNTLDNSKFHISECKNNQSWGWPNGNREIVDHILLSNSDVMFEYSNLYDKLHEYTSPNQCPQYNTISHHFLMVWHLEKMNLLNEETVLKTFNTIPNYDANSDISTNYDIFRYRKLTREQVKEKINE
jgi:hypothetical protein